MTFHKDLFLKICQKYGVQFSGDYDSVMLNDNGRVRKLSEYDVGRILFPAGIITYSDTADAYTDPKVRISDVPQEDLSAIKLQSDEFLVAA